MADEFARELVAKEEARRKVRIVHPRKCEECGVNPGDPRICPGCEAYREHTGHF